MKQLCLGLLFLSFTFLVNAQNLNSKKLDSLLDVLAQNNKTMGTLAITKSGKNLYQKTVGYKSMKNGFGKNASNNDLYRIGSISKMFTATIIFQLIDEKQISLNTTLDKYFATVPNSGKITIGNLLNHHSGIHNITADAETYLSYYLKPQTKQQMVKVISNTKPDFEPGAKAAYSNSNYILLGYIAEAITKKQFSVLVTERITAKAKLKNTFVGNSKLPKPNEVSSFSYENGWKVEPKTDMTIPGGAGSVISTSADLTLFIDALFAGKLVSTTSLKTMQTINDGYGSGMLQFPYENEKLYGHNGAIDGFNSILSFCPTDSMSIAYICNGSNYKMNDILLGALAIYYNKPYVIPTFGLKKAEIESDELSDQFVGTYYCEQNNITIVVEKKGNAIYYKQEGETYGTELVYTGGNTYEAKSIFTKLEFLPAIAGLKFSTMGMDLSYTRKKEK